MINTIAGGGSLVSLPLLIFAGLPANVANASNRPAILFSSMVASYQFAKNKSFEKNHSLWLAIPVFLGSIPGALISVNLDESVLKNTIGSLLVVTLFLILTKPEKFMRSHNPRPFRGRYALSQSLLYFLLGIYGGFIQAGIGFFIVFSSVFFSGIGLIQANAMKVFLTFILTIPALFVFISNGLVEWDYALLLSCGSLPGSWIGSKMTVSRGPSFARAVLIGVISISAVRLLIF